MARGTTLSEKEPNRVVQIWRAYRVAAKYDSAITWYLVLIFLACIAAGIVLGVLFGGGVVGLVLAIILAVVLGVLLDLVVLSRRVERAYYAQIAGQPGAVGAVLKSGLRRSWIGTEIPVNVSPKTQDAVYQAVGRGGVVLVGEGPRSRTQRMVDDEKRRVSRIVPNVPITSFFVGEDADSTPLHRLPVQLQRLKKNLTAAEVQAVSARLASLTKTPGGIGIPKGIDPTKVRASKPR